MNEERTQIEAHSLAYDIVASFAISGYLDSKVTAKEATERIENALNQHLETHREKYKHTKEDLRNGYCNNCDYGIIDFDEWYNETHKNQD